MRATTTKEMTVTLILNEAEAEYIRALTQNALCEGGFHDEDPEHRKIRTDIFDAVRKALQ